MNPRGSNILLFVLFRILLPIILLTAAILRYNGLSLGYSICLLFAPLMRVPNQKSMLRETGVYLKFIVTMSLLPILGHIIFHVTLVAIASENDPYGSMFKNCSFNEKLVRQIGFQRLDNASVGNIIRLVAPDALVFVTSVILLAVSVKITKPSVLYNSPTEQPLLGPGKQRGLSNLMRTFLQFCRNLALLGAGIIVPSILSGVYFIVFLVVLTLWGCYIPMGRRFNYIQNLLLFYTASHLLLLHIYQFQFFQETLKPTDIIARIMGLTGIVETDCSNVDSILFHPGVRWSAFVNPAILLTLYWMMAINKQYVKYRSKQSVEHHPSGSLLSSTVPTERQVYQTSLNESLWSVEKQRVDMETGSMVFSGSFEGDDDGGEDEPGRPSTPERLVENEEPPGGRYGGVEERPSNNTVEVSTMSCPDDEKTKRRPWMSIVYVIMKQSYVLSLIAMMVWSITYHSWLTFAFLLTACLLWMMPNSRTWCLRASPLILLYAELLLLAQYIFGMDLNDELPKNAGAYKLDEIGLKRFVDPSINIALQCLYTMFLVLALRQYFSEQRRNSEEIPPGILLEIASKRHSIFETFISLDLQERMYDSKTMVFIGNFLWVLFCKYWIIFCSIMMAIISLQDVVIYRIIYMFLFLFFVLLFQYNYKVWRTANYMFWWIVVIYSMLVLILIYTYQFEQFKNYWVSLTGFDEELLKDIGLERYDTTGLFVKLLTPTSFLVFVILQLRYFHHPFLKLSALDRYIQTPEDVNLNQTDDERLAQNMTEDEDENNSAAQTSSKRHSTRNWLKRHILRGLEQWNRFTLKLWRLGEIHFFKLICLIIIVVAANEVSALTAVYVLILSILLPIPKAHLFLSHLTQFWTVVIILAKMIYQLNLVETKYWKTNCTEIYGVNGTVNSTVETDNALWFGLMKIDSQGTSLAHYLRLYLLIMVLIAFESIIRYHQKQYFNQSNITKPQTGIIFASITRNDADKGIVRCTMFFANYFFYKFGLECCYIMTAVTVSIRVDVIAVLYILVVACFIMQSRRNIARVWPIYKLFLAVLLAVQFFVVLGFPSGLCIDYPWIMDNAVSNNLKQWLFLPDYVASPHSSKLVADLLQLLFVSLQSFVFHLEADHEKMEAFGGGDNADIVEDVEANKPILCDDFTIDTTKGINLLKYFIFENMFWVTMAVIFITGATRINIFSLFYVIAVFCFMWYGKELFLKPIRKMLLMWNFLIMYCILVLFLKTTLQLIGCVYVAQLIDNHQCWLVQLFGVNCLLAGVQTPVSTGVCVVEKDDAGLAWDVICLTFLLFQRRVYSSYYFRHIVTSLRAQNNLVSRGAELINRIMIREVNKQNEQEKEILVNIKKQMKALKKKQAKLKKDYKEPEEHFQAIRAGDYYLFEDEGEDETPVNVQTSLTFGTEPEDPAAKPTPAQVINTAIDQGMTAAIVSYEDVSEIPTRAEAHVSSPVDPPDQDEPESVGKLRVIAGLITTVWFSIIDWIIAFCNRLSRNYRLVAKKLTKEMVIEKQKVLARTESSFYFSKEVTPDVQPSTSSDFKVDIEEDILPGISRKSESLLSLDELEKEDEEEIQKQFKTNRDRFSRLTMAVGLLLASRSELLCYFLMILNQMVYGSLLSLPLPLMVFLWGMLSVPRPSKTFWITVITYTEAVVVCKYMFQFGFFPWNDGVFRDNPFFPPRIIGIEKQSNYANVDIALLLALFLHRSILRKYGLWRDAADITADLEAAGAKEQSTPNSPSKVFDEDVVFGKSVSNVDALDGRLTPSCKPRSKLGQGFSYILNPFRKFFRQVTESSYNATADVYAPMFFCDFILFLVLVLSFSSFGPAETAGDGDVTSYIKNNKIPIPFLFMLIAQFVCIIIDRAIFLRKFVLGKFIFQILLVIAIHIWMFFLLPAITKRSFFNNVAAQIWYFTKCIYFGLSAYQIRCGYPNRILGNFLTKKYTYTNLFLFKGFLAIPFLLELRALMDWIWTDSTLAIGNWLQMEDIYANIFVLKCWREIEKQYPTERAIKKKPWIKYVSGGILLVIVVFIVWFPLVFFSFFNAVFISNPPNEATMSVSISGYQPLFSSTALGNTIHTLTDAEYSTLKTHYSRDRNAYSFLSGYDASDVSLLSFDGKSLAIWGISPVSQKSMMNDLSDDSSTSKLMLSVEHKFQREPDQVLPSDVSCLFEVNLRDVKYKNVRHTFARIINSTTPTNESVVIHELFPRFLRLGGTSKAVPIDVLNNGIGLSNISMQLQIDPSNSLSEWWNLKEIVSGTVYAYKRETNTSYDKSFIITFNDRKAPASLSFLSGYGIIGLYLSFILLIGRLMRLSTTNQYLTIMFRELPDVDRIMKLCLDLYLVREMKEFQLEEEIYAKLIFLYRSPETTIKYTRQTVRSGIFSVEEKEKED
ncbi:piezo-type mechanosensitive ion channel component 2-like isoform X3 [Physella acuta]|uniref:piezo-type mechanosensitive ion channel component 2-like isoform X3 n=1 Tax=Physella acuta TaxID=109671 RepID=UPI0027DC473E|nr:piezo-type mechanosensitive ion channel component 2-like isoform X3 [Physella acuta]